MKKKILVAVLLILPLAVLAADDLNLKQGAKIEITTRTAYGVNIDDTNQQGLQMDFVQLGIYYDMLGGGAVSNSIKTDDPVGFMQLEFGGLQLRFTTANNLLPDDNNPNPIKSTAPNATTPTDTRLGWNAGSTGYFSPIYIERFISGIAFGPVILQLAAGGDAPENWRPWSRNNGFYAQSQIIDRWAYMDTRLQYRRESVPLYIKSTLTNGLPAETVYWKDGESYDDISLNPSGTMIGLQFNQPDFSLMAKFATEHELSELPTAADQQNGLAFGLDTSLTPIEVKGLRIFASAAKEINYGPDGSPQPMAFGGKASFDIPIADPLSLEPYAGYQIVLFDTPTYAKPNTQEFSAGLTLHWPGNGGWQYDALQQRNGVLFPGLTLAWTAVDKTMASNDDALVHNLRFTLFEESGDYGLIPAVGSEISVQYSDIANPEGKSQALTTAYFDVAINDVFGGVLTPWTRLFWDNIGVGDGVDRINNIKVDLGLKLSKAIRNTVIGLDWESKNLTAASQDIKNLDTTNGYYGFGFVKVWVEVKL